MNLGLLLLRVVVGALMMGHGTQKLFGWFGGPGRKGAAGFVGSLGYQPAMPLAILLGTAEATGGALLVTGLAVPIGSTLIGAVMLNAIVTVHLKKGVWNENGGFEFPLTMWTAALAPAFIGAGAYSLDHAIGWDMSGIVPGFYALAAGVLLGGVGLALRGRHESMAEETKLRRRAA